MAKEVDPDALEGIIEAFAEAIALIAFTTGNPNQVDGMIRAFTDLAATPAYSTARRNMLRSIGMQMHDNRVRNAAWKEGLTTPRPT